MRSGFTKRTSRHILEAADAKRMRFDPFIAAAFGPSVAAFFIPALEWEMANVEKMKVHVTIDCSGAAFQGPRRDHEIASVLRQAALKVEQGSSPSPFEFTLKDTSGVDCGLCCCKSE